jgi:hypothetical protein
VNSIWAESVKEERVNPGRDEKADAVVLEVGGGGVVSKRGAQDLELYSHAALSLN